MSDYKIVYLVSYDISNDEVRNEFRNSLKNTYNLVDIGKSIYGFSSTDCKEQIYSRVQNLLDESYITQDVKRNKDDKIVLLCNSKKVDPNITRTDSFNIFGYIL